MGNKSQSKAIVLTPWKETVCQLFLFWGIDLFQAFEALTSLILSPLPLSPIFTEFFPLSSFLTTVKQTLGSS